MRSSPPKLLVHHPEKSTKEFLIEGPEVVIGRDPACQLPLDDRKISRSHARILDRQGRLTLRDLGSRNGTYINDKRIGPEDGEVTLGDQDRIRIGSHIILCAVPGAPTATRKRGSRKKDRTALLTSVSKQLLDLPEDVPEAGGAWPPKPEPSQGDELETGVIRQKELRTALEAEDPETEKEMAVSVDLDLRTSELDAIRERASESEPEPAVAGMLEPEGEEEAHDPSGDTSVLPQVSGDTNYDIMADLEKLRVARARVLICREADEAVSLQIERRRVAIGRGRQNDMVISHHTVSSVHAEIQFGPEGFALIDKNSTNGTYVENARVLSRRLRDGSYMIFGGVMAMFFHEMEFDAEKEKKSTRSMIDVLVQRGTLTRTRAGEAIEQAEVTGQRTAEVLILRGDITPGQWWEASRLIDPARTSGFPVSIFVVILGILALAVAAVAIIANI
ncbi:MAG: FHA domain-containing protein [Planctomycetota bacterium]|nr:FHA domain-containing protein [Planctomycetota bacterium]